MYRRSLLNSVAVGTIALNCRNYSIAFSHFTMSEAEKAKQLSSIIFSKDKITRSYLSSNYDS